MASPPHGYLLANKLSEIASIYLIDRAYNKQSCPITRSHSNDEKLGNRPPLMKMHSQETRFSSAPSSRLFECGALRSCCEVPKDHLLLALAVSGSEPSSPSLAWDFGSPRSPSAITLTILSRPFSFRVALRV